MAPQAATKSFFLSTRWVVAATSSGAPVVTTSVLARMTLITLTDRISLTV